MRYQPATQQLEFTVGRGFRSHVIHKTHVRQGQGFAGKAALDQTWIVINDLRTSKDHFIQSLNQAGEDFPQYFALPLVAKGEIQGVLELFYRQPRQLDPEWHSFLETLAGQSAIAIYNIGVFNSLQRSNNELGLAYDTTLEGWARALELRDQETEGHSRRVNDLVLNLAQQFGIEGEDLRNLRRGALLHDIGKMAIPDKILLKPGPLTDEEWVVMKQHPGYALDLLSRILYLSRAIDIPYYHHEKWDGSGYPQGLCEEEIPLAARIFSIVDVWDALTSDRPYRKAWQSDRVRAYLIEQSGHHFDPAVVRVFLTMLSNEIPAFI